MPPTLAVHVSDDGLHSVRAEPPSFEAAGAFDVELVNHGRAVHVHLNLVEGLERGAELEATNHFVDTDAIRQVGVDVVDDALPASGKLKVVTGYGAETTYVDVTVTEPPDAPRTGTGELGSEGSVAVDETLAEPSPVEQPDDPGASSVPTALSARENAPVAALAGVAVLVAAAAATLVDGVVAALGVAIVLAGVAAAGVLLARE
ncbi:DUF7524 family protein [Halostella litorea]|uniref:DUF7524 family protein n=1 Tax=Halostella litorea TaxID=2528831 RepID=UPI0010923B65|nr:hypothetical protein [Halostella litorea]